MIVFDAIILFHKIQPCCIVPQCWNNKTKQKRENALNGQSFPLHHHSFSCLVFFLNNHIICAAIATTSKLESLYIIQYLIMWCATQGVNAGNWATPHNVQNITHTKAPNFIFLFTPHWIIFSKCVLFLLWYDTEFIQYLWMLVSDFHTLFTPLCSRTVSALYFIFCMYFTSQCSRARTHTFYSQILFFSFNLFLIDFSNKI